MQARHTGRALFAAAVGFVTAGVVVIASLSAIVRLRQGCSVDAIAGVPSTSAAHEIPARLLVLYRAAEQRYGVPWNVLAAINKVETDFGHDQGKAVPRGIAAPSARRENLAERS